MIKKICNIKRKLQLNVNLLFVTSSIAVLLYSIYLVKNLGVYHGELDIYIPHYLSSKPALSIIFDPICELDLTRSSFRGREVGSFFNLIDSRLLLLFFQYGIGSFISIVNIIAIASIMASLVIISCKINSNERLIVYLIGLLYLTSPPIIFSGIFYRTNKVIAAAAIYFSIILIYKLINESYSGTKNFILVIIIFIIQVIACLADEQGLAIIILISAFLGVDTLQSGKNKIKAFAVSITAIATSFVYKNYLGKELFRVINGIVPNELSMESSNFLNINNLSSAYTILLKYISYLYGNLFYQSINQGLIYTAIIGLGIILVIFNRRINIYVLTKLILIFLFLVYVLNVMIYKHPAILWSDMITYYNIPIVTFLFSISIVFVKLRYIHYEIPSKYQINKIELSAIFILLFLILSNLSSINSFKDKIVSGHINPYMNGDKIISAIYGDKEHREEVINDIKLNSIIPGSRVDMKYSEAGSEAIRLMLNK